MNPEVLTFLETLPDPLFVVAADRTIVFANASAKELFGKVEMNGDLALSVRHPQVLSAVDNVFVTGNPEQGELTLTGPIPRTFDLHVRSVISQGSDGRTLRQAILTFHDKTDATRTNAMRADFVANASHELRSPLTAILGFIETLKGSAGDKPETRARFLNIMGREAERMKRLVDDLMTLSRVETDEHVRPREELDVKTVLTNVRELLGERASKRDIAIELEFNGAADAVMGDSDQLVQVFRNLIENAINYGTPGTNVNVEVENLDRIPEIGNPGVAVHVKDQGAGIPREHIPRLTERFYRVDMARTRSNDDLPVSTGLGLAIVKHIVNRHRGRLRIRSIDGEGSTFSVFLPKE